MGERDTVPRGRHAPPLEVRQDRQLQRLSDAAAAVFARTGYADATAEAIAREAGMSKATFYEHFANKEDCIVGLFDRANARLIDALDAVHAAGTDLSPQERYGVSIRAMLGVMAAYPDHARTLMVEIVGAGPRALARRDAVLEAIAAYAYERNQEDVAAGRAAPLASYDDAYGVVGAMLELCARHLRSGKPADIEDLEPVIVRLFRGVIGTSVAEQPAAT